MINIKPGGLLKLQNATHYDDKDILKDMVLI